MVVLRRRLEPEVGALVMQALAAAREALYQKARAQEQERSADADTHSADVPAGATSFYPDTSTMAQQQADALALLAETALHHGLEPGPPGERYQVVVHLDAEVLADADAPGQSVLEEGTRVSAETSQRLACDATRVVMRHDQDGRLLEVGARTRTIPPAAPRPRLPLSRLQRAFRPGPPHPSLGARWPDDALEPHLALSAAPPGSARGGLSS